MTAPVRLTILAILLAACDDPTPRPLAAPPPPLPPGNGPVVLSVSNSTPAAGEVVQLTARLRPASRLVVASYLIRLSYQASGLSYLRDITPPGGLRALNPAAGLIRSAGAAPAGFADGVLFVLEFRVNDPRALATLELRLEELNGVDYRSSLPRNTADRAARLDQGQP